MSEHEYSWAGEWVIFTAFKCSFFPNLKKNHENIKEQNIVRQKGKSEKLHE